MGTLNFQKLKVRDDYLQGSIAALKTEEGVEAKIREEYGYVRDGEEMVMVINDKSATPVIEEEEEKGFFEKLFDW